MEYLKENLEIVQKKIQAACEKSHRNMSDITLIGVTKTIDIQRMQTLKQLGVVNFGENKVQELLSKWETFENNVRWHLIGHLQTNKVKYIMDKVVLIHSVDGIKLAEEIQRHAVQQNRTMDILIEVNIAKEESKHGIAPEALFPLLEEMKSLDRIRIQGLMTVAPFVEEPEENRRHFKNMRKLFEDAKELLHTNVEMKYLSMGMTNDYPIAIEEGANMVRIGTGLFGSRNYN